MKVRERICPTIDSKGSNTMNVMDQRIKLAKFWTAYANGQFKIANTPAEELLAAPCPYKCSAAMNAFISAALACKIYDDGKDCGCSHIVETVACWDYLPPTSPEVLP
jgi:hypothetical protein